MKLSHPNTALRQASPLVCKPAVVTRSESFGTSYVGTGHRFDESLLWTTLVYRVDAATLAKGHPVNVCARCGLHMHARIL